ncbi:hypothetical protein VUR80DRAFT_3906 [Thermomyces stellatus]
MSLPTAKTTQSSILSFFQQKQPKYAPPPSSRPTESAASQPPPTAPTPSAPPRSSEAKSDAPPRNPTPTPSPHPQAAIRPVAPADITALRRINSLLLPVAYPDTFYQHVLDPSVSALFSRVITWADDGAAPKVVGGIVCRLEEVAGAALAPIDEGYHVLYIQSLGVLAPYRGLGLASAALDQVLGAAQRDPSIDVRYVYAHVWTKNEDGLSWYRARGFTCSDKPVEGYYFKLQPDSAWVVQRDLSPLKSAPEGAPPPQAVPASATARLANLPDRNAPPRNNSGQSFQNLRPEMEWNDLPADMAPPSRSSGASSAQSSRSSSSARKKRDRAYPVQAFGK